MICLRLNDSMKILLVNKFYYRRGGVCHRLSGEFGYTVEEILPSEYEYVDGFYPSVWIERGESKG